MVVLLKRIRWVLHLSQLQKLTENNPKNIIFTPKNLSGALLARFSGLKKQKLSGVPLDAFID